VLATRSLPGIRVDVAPPPAVEALPRMDVAVLVGFASTGPLHVPVAIESVAQYAAVFGPDAPLAWDAQRGERVQALLGPAVRAFFANGGRRCWVIRVARVESARLAPGSPAKANGFALPGVLELSGGGLVGPALARARCEGSWSDPLRVASAMQKRTLGLEGFGPVAPPGSARFAFHTRYGLREGDLVEIDDDDGHAAYATIDAVRVVANPAGPYAVQCSVRAAFERVTGAASPPSSPPSALAGEAGVEGFFGSLPATLVPPSAAGEPALLRFDLPVPASLECGHWARWSDGSATLWLRIDELDREADFSGSPPALDTTRVRATARGPAWRELGAILPFAATGVRRAHLLALDLRVDESAGAAFRLAAAGLTPAHPQGWWTNWSDADFYRPDDDVGAGPATQVVPAEVPRFPLSRRDAPLPLAWIPLGVEPLFRDALAPLPEPLTKLERDGLVPFEARLFLDPDLAGAPSQSIAGIADSVRFLQAPTRALRGLHAAWSIGAGGLFNEASLIAIPDAIHLGWHKRVPGAVPPPEPTGDGTPAPWLTHRGPCAKAGDETRLEPDFGAFLDCATRAIEAPVLDGPDLPVPPGAYRLAWTPVEPGARYVLVEATQPDFGDRREIYTGPGTEFIALNPREGNYYYLVFAWVGDNRSAASNAIVVVVRSDDWVQDLPDDAGAPIEGEWLAVHRAVLRMAAASGELFAALAMPRHFRTQHALRYAARLRAVGEPPAMAEPDAFGHTERAVLSYGAMYFPWLQADARTGAGTQDTSIAALLPGKPRVVPPDGVALGVLAARATSRGAWIAAANEPMKDVVGLTPAITASDWQALQDAQVNLLRDDPRGFLALAADTLAVDTELRPINVRRLLILLRRLALRRGVSYVFEPNGPVLRRAVERGFNALLGELFRRGAFAGRTAEESYRVVTDDTLNTPGDYEAGRFLVELRVAPALPMRFISILLAQGGERLTVTEEL
jgi:hypothetical protein